MTFEEMQFYSTIRDTLAQHPEWMGTAINAVLAGSHEAVERANQRANQMQVGFMSALTLAKDGRLTPEIKELMNALVIRNGIFGLSRDDEMKVPSLCEAEREFIRRAANAIDDNENAR